MMIRFTVGLVSLASFILLAVVVFYRGVYDGVWLMMCISAGVFGWSIGLMSPATWFEDGPDERPEDMGPLDRWSRHG